MKKLYRVCCGIDVHKRTLTACLLMLDALGNVTKERRKFGTHTADLRELLDWLLAAGCTHVAMESTGVYWRPVFNILEGRLQVLLVNAQHVQNVPGRKTDACDAEWIAELLQHGLLRGSFVPPQEIRDLRDLTRYRTKLTARRASECNRIQKVLEECNIKLGSVATNVLGVSGREMLEAIVRGEDDPKVLAEMARGRLRKKIPQLLTALQGLVREHHRWLLDEMLSQVSQLTEAIAKLDERIERMTKPYAELIEQLDAIPGVNRRVAEVIIAEIGVDMKQFPSPAHLCSWAAICPGNHESAGRRQSGRMRRGNMWLKSALTQAAWAASRTKDSYLSAQWHNIVRRRGKKRANMAVGHSILKISHVLLSHPGLVYTDLGVDYFDRRDKDYLIRKLIRRLESLGLQVAIQQPAA